MIHIDTNIRKKNQVYHKKFGRYSRGRYTVFRARRITFFPACLIELNTKNSSAGWVFGVQLGLRQTQALIKTKTIGRGKVPPATLLLSSKLLLSCNIAGGYFPLLIVLVVISPCVCWRPSWTPKTQPGAPPHLVEFLVFNSILMS